MERRIDAQKPFIKNNLLHYLMLPPVPGIKQRLGRTTVNQEMEAIVKGREGRKWWWAWLPGTGLRAVVA